MSRYCEFCGNDDAIHMVRSTTTRMCEYCIEIYKAGQAVEIDDKKIAEKISKKVVDTLRKQFSISIRVALSIGIALFCYFFLQNP